MGTHDRVTLGGRGYALRAVLKSDRYARSSLLEDREGRRFVLKESVMRLPPGIRVPALAGLLARHEADLYERLAGLPGIPRLAGRPRRDAFLREYVEGCTLREVKRPPDGFFGALEGVLRGVHSRGVAYVDLAKEENVIVGADGRPWLVDFQVSVARQGPLLPLVGWLQREDLYHLSKLRLRRRPDEASAEDRRRVAGRSRLGRLHRATVKKAYNVLTRYLVKRWSGAGEGRTALLLVAAAALGCAAPPGVAPPPAPPAVAVVEAGLPQGPWGPPAASLDGVPYDEPARCLPIDGTTGSSTPLGAAAAEVRAATPEETLLAIHRWIDGRFRTDGRVARESRPVERLLEDRTLGGPTDRAVLFGSLARACGIPTAWVKAVSWEAARAAAAHPEAPPPTDPAVLLEVFVGNRWRLLDASSLLLWEDYDPRSRLLPGERLAVDKGTDPAAMVFGNRRDLWLRQWAEIARGLDTALLPAARPTDLRRLAVTIGRVFIAGDAGLADRVHDRCEALGVPRALTWSFADEFERFLPRARGRVLLVLCPGGRTVLPPESRAEFLPAPEEEVRRIATTSPPGILRRRLADGTRVVLLHGRNDEGVLAAARLLEAADVAEAESP